jgi:hypothetical protein
LGFRGGVTLPSSIFKMLFRMMLLLMCICPLTCIHAFSAVTAATSRKDRFMFTKSVGE